MKNFILSRLVMWVDCPHCKIPFEIKEKELWYICPSCKEIIDIDYEKLIENAHIGVKK